MEQGCEKMKCNKSNGNWHSPVFKKNLKTIMLGAALVASLLPEELCSSMSYCASLEARTVPASVLSKQYMTLKRLCSLATARSVSFVRKYPLVTIGVGAAGILAFGLVGYYSGLFSWMQRTRIKEKTPLIDTTKEEIKTREDSPHYDELKGKNGFAKNISLEMTNPENSLACTEIVLSTNRVECLLKSTQNRSWEDVGTLSRWKLYDKEAVIMAVFDGNGHQGKPKISRLLAKKFQQKIANELLQLADKDIHDQKLVSEKLTTLFRDFDKTLSCEKGGSTACIAVFLPQHKVFVVANTGDSQLGLIQDVDGKSELFVTARHNPEEECVDAGGRIPKNAITYVEYKGCGYFQNESCNLGLSRAFGYVDDEKGTKAFTYLIVDPEVTVFDLNKTIIKGVVIGCDGLWDPFEENIKAYAQSIIEKIKDEKIHNLGQIADDAIQNACNTPIKLVPRNEKVQPAEESNDDDITVGLMRFK